MLAIIHYFVEVLTTVAPRNLNELTPIVSKYSSNKFGALGKVSKIIGLLRFPQMNDPSCS
eukprot:c5749_g1_i1 orf=222-401(-)